MSWVCAPFFTLRFIQSEWCCRYLVLSLLQHCVWVYLCVCVWMLWSNKLIANFLRPTQKRVEHVLRIFKKDLMNHLCLCRKVVIHRPVAVAVAVLIHHLFRLNHQNKNTLFLKMFKTSTLCRSHRRRHRHRHRCRRRRLCLSLWNVTHKNNGNRCAVLCCVVLWCC